MFSFIVQIALMASLAVIVYMLARALPRVANEQTEAQEDGALDRFAKHIPLEKLDTSIHKFFIKLLRKIRVLVAKFDNLLNEYISGLKETSVVQNPAESIKEKMDLLVNGEKEKAKPARETTASDQNEAEADIEEEKI